MSKDCQESCPYLARLHDEEDLQIALDSSYMGTPMAYVDVWEKYTEHEARSVDCPGPETVESFAVKSLFGRRKTTNVQRHTFCPRQ